MSIALTIDQRKSRSSRPELVDRWVEELNEEFSATLRLPFVVTVGDEFQGLTDDSSVAVELVLRGAQSHDWWIGVGLGDVELPLPAAATRSRGNAFYRAREAVERAKSEQHGFSVRGPDAAGAEQAETALQLLTLIVQSRGNATRSRNVWEAIELRRSGATLEQIATAQSVSFQAVSQRLQRAGYEEERRGRILAATLMDDADNE